MSVLGSIVRVVCQVAHTYRWQRRARASQLTRGLHVPVRRENCRTSRMRTGLARPWRPEGGMTQQENR
eukprot:8953412-Pyramimonas_sp.AAC.1